VDEPRAIAVIIVTGVIATVLAIAATIRIRNAFREDRRPRWGPTGLAVFGLLAGAAALLVSPAAAPEGPSFGRWATLLAGLSVALAVGGVLDLAERRRWAWQDHISDQAKRLQDSEQSVASLVEASADPILVLDAVDASIVDANEKLRELLGVERDAILGAAPEAWILAPSHRTPSEVLEKALEPVNESDRIIILRTCDDEAVESEVSASRIVYHGRPASLVTVRDVSALERARRAAEESGRAKTAFLSGISHEIRTPLNAILGLTKLARDTDPIPGEHLASIERCARDLLVTVEDLLDLSRLEVGELTLSKEVFDPRALIWKILRHLSPRARAKDLVLVSRVERDVPELLSGDARRVEKALFAMIGHAIHRSEVGEIAVRFSRCQRDADDGSACFELDVLDSGQESQDDLRERIVAPFRRNEYGVRQDSSQTSIALALVSEALRAMGGSLRIEQTSDAGAHTVATLPLAIAEDGRPPRMDERLVGRTGLVVHGSEAVRDSMAETLLTLGVRTTTASNWVEAVAALKSSAERGRAVEIMLAEAELLDASPPGPLDLGGHSRDAVAVIALATSPRVKWPHFAIEGLVIPCSLSLVRHALRRGLRRLGRGDSMPSGPCGQRDGTLLIVEDSAVNRKLLETTLLREGFGVLTANDGLDALEVLRTRSVDLVLMDVQMPVLDGLEATRRIRSEPRFADLPVIALTAHARAEDRDNCLEAGMNEYLAKPVDREELLATVFEWLENRDDSGPVETPPEREPRSSDVSAPVEG
jgi:two-component system sensor histidine kinase/response regulator